MNHVIDENIRFLLMEEERVCLPGLGTLVLQPQPATISSMQGKVSPPARLVHFNSNLVLDDGTIELMLIAGHDYSDAEASAAVADYMRNLRENLDAGRSYSIEGVGRFYQPVPGQIKFTPTGDNFSKDSFGLPTIDAQPIIRNERQRRATVDPMLGGTAAAPAGQTRRQKWSRRLRQSLPGGGPTKHGSLLYNDQLRSILWYVTAGMVALLLLFALYKLFQYSLGTVTEDPVPTVRNERPRLDIPRDRVNVAPGPPPVPAEEVAPDPAPRLRDQRERSEDVVAAAPGGEVADEEITAEELDNDLGRDDATDLPPANTAPATGERVALIATGMFGSQRNVAKNLDRLRAAGFTTFDRPEGRLTRLGARVAYQDPAALNAALERLQRLYPDAFVMEIDGVRQ